MSESNFLFAIFLLLAVAGLAGIFLYGWRRRKDEPPRVAPFPRTTTGLIIEPRRFRFMSASDIRSESRRQFLKFLSG